MIGMRAMAENHLVKDKEGFKVNKELCKIIILIFFLIACVLVNYYFYFILKKEVVFTHFFYLPIIFASFWWPRKGLSAAVFLGLLLLVPHCIKNDSWNVYLADDAARAVMFIVVSVVISILSKRGRVLRDKLIGYTELLENKTEALSSANLRLKELDRLKSMFIASMNHELRTPLNSIMGFTSLLLSGAVGKITEEQTKQLEMVEGSANHLLLLINDIIDVNMIEAGKVKIIIRKFNLSSLLEEIRETFRIAAEEKGIKFFLEAPKELVVVSDERRVKQVIMNLVSNAMKFTDKGEVKIKAVKKYKNIDISVKDTGIGIKKEDINRLFKAFGRIPHKDMVILEGTGLGLYITKKLTERLGGDIKVKSEFAEGSEFTFILPLVFSDEEIQISTDNDCGGGRH